MTTAIDAYKKTQGILPPIPTPPQTKRETARIRNINCHSTSEIAPTSPNPATQGIVTALAKTGIYPLSPHVTNLQTGRFSTIARSMRGDGIHFRGVFGYTLQMIAYYPTLAASIDYANQCEMTGLTRTFFIPFLPSIASNVAEVTKVRCQLTKGRKINLPSLHLEVLNVAKNARNGLLFVYLREVLFSTAVDKGDKGGPLKTAINCGFAGLLTVPFDRCGNIAKDPHNTLSTIDIIRKKIWYPLQKQALQAALKDIFRGGASRTGFTFLSGGIVGGIRSAFKAPAVRIGSPYTPRVLPTHPECLILT